MAMGDIWRMTQSNVVPLPIRTSVFDAGAFARLLRRSGKPVRGGLHGIGYQARVAIANYDQHIAKHYRAILPDGLAAACSQADIHFDTPQFGLIIEFEEPAEIAVHDGDMVLDDSLRALVAQFGGVILRNATVAGDVRQRFHRNIFPHLKFHVDRGPTSANQYSCFTRDPDDPAQRQPRLSSTVFVANIVAWLEMIARGHANTDSERGVRASYDLFQDGKAGKLFGKVILEQPWIAPAGNGEIAVIDNRTVLHATFDKHNRRRGYPIGARYLI
ncbi:MAG: hypothetical protein QF384_05980 [Alphaproteobacteria bacterium]|nr:hypothetical protein [Alphaproteobacteria bacterium]